MKFSKSTMKWFNTQPQVFPFVVLMGQTPVTVTAYVEEFDYYETAGDAGIIPGEFLSALPRVEPAQETPPIAPRIAVVESKQPKLLYRRGQFKAQPCPQRDA